MLLRKIPFKFPSLLFLFKFLRDIKQLIQLRAWLISWLSTTPFTPPPLPQHYREDFRGTIVKDPRERRVWKGVTYQDKVSNGPKFWQKILPVTIDVQPEAQQKNLHWSCKLFFKRKYSTSKEKRSLSRKF